MFGNNKTKDVKIVKGGSVDTLITGKTTITGDIQFSGVLFLDGTIKGNVKSDDDKALLTVGPNGLIEGEVHVPNVVIQGKVSGDVYARAHASLAASAHIEGSVYYHLIEMMMGAEVNGRLVHQPATPKQLEHKPD
jgi:cytoskeletal protein CcmA (bactofilin family)